MPHDPAVRAVRPALRGRWPLLALLALLLAASVAPVRPPGAAAGEGPPVYGMVFPLIGEATLTDSFGDPRGRTRRHQGVDVLADKGVPVVAVADGTVRWVHRERGGRCCALAVRHDDGWRSRYIHLDNDTPGTDDGRAVGVAAGLARGTRVAAGQVVGWVGDSGNAEETVSHLHFELRRPDGTPVDPLPSLRAALRVGRPVAPMPDRAVAGVGEREGDDEPSSERGWWSWLLPDDGEGAGDAGGGEEGGDVVAERAAPDDAADEPATPGSGSEAAGGDRGGERRAVRDALPSAPAVPPGEGEPLPRRSAEGTVPPPGVPPAAEGSALHMERRVELVPRDDCCDGVVGEEERQAEEGGNGGWLACFGFTPRDAAGGETGSRSEAGPVSAPTTG